MNKTKIEIQRTSMTGHSILVITTPSDKSRPSFQQQVPTHLAMWMKVALEERNDEPEDYLTKEE